MATVSSRSTATLIKAGKICRRIINLNFKDFNDHRPFACVLIGIELTEAATPIASFSHPRQACYLLGSEDSGLSPEAIECCQSIIKLPGSRSLNVSVAGSLVMFDRVQKQRLIN